MTDTSEDRVKELAEDLRNRVSELNMAISEASRAGLLVEVDIMEQTVINCDEEVPHMLVKVFKRL